MTKSPAKPRPVRVGTYRYSKLRWRLLVHALDFCGTILMAVFRRVRPVRTVDRPRRILVVQLDHLGDAVLSTPLIAELRAAYPLAAIDVLASPSNHEVFEADPHVNKVTGRRTDLVRAAAGPVGPGDGGLETGLVAAGDAIMIWASTCAGTC